MKSAWQIETGHLICRWRDLGEGTFYHPSWMQTATGAQGSYLPSLVPDFGRHSPFGGAVWFKPHPAASRENSSDSDASRALR